MKPAFFLLIFFLSLHTANGQANKNFDSSLAKKLNADPYGMKRYILVILKTGSVAISDKKITDSLFRGHMQNIRSLATQNKLVVAGPMGKNDKKYEGIFVLNTDNMEEAQKLLQTDPAIHAKILDVELYPWYASAALQQTLEIHDKIQKVNF